MQYTTNSVHPFEHIESFPRARDVVSSLLSIVQMVRVSLMSRLITGSSVLSAKGDGN